jgi:SIR2-like domain
MPRSPQEAFERLIAAVRCGRALPFVGAGVSFDSECDGAQAPRTSDLEDRLARHLYGLYKKCKVTRQALLGALSPDRKSVRSANAFKELGLCWLAQQVAQLEGGEHLELCRILEIERFCRLRPTRAHRYLAFLAREGLIKEIITTNYDQCLEKAFNESWVPAREHPQPHVVHDADTNIHRMQHGEPPLTIYKINGCAGQFERTAESARRIVLTELDLQAWHGEGWASRVFAERVGQRPVILSGFGAEEPQVRFTVTALCKEFKATQEPVSPMEAAEVTNAPFVHAFERTPNRFQQQVLYAWFTARTDEAQRRELKTAARLHYMLANAFTGEHSSFFRGAGNHLPADGFWEAVFMAAWRRLLCQELSGGTTAAFLTGLEIDPTEFAEDVGAMLFPRERDRCDRCALLALDAGENSPAMLLARAVHALCPAREAPPESGSYMALGDQPLLLGLLLLFWAWCHEAGTSLSVDISSDNRLGLRLPRRDKRETWLACPPFASSGATKEGPGSDDLAFVQIALCTSTDGALYRTSALRPPTVPTILDARESEAGEIFRRYGIRIDAQLLLELAARELQEGGVAGSGWSALQAALDRVVEYPGRWLLDYRPSFRDRTREMS